MPSCSVMGDAGPAAHMVGMKEAVAAVVIIFVLTDLTRTAVRICRNPQHRREYSETVRSLRWWMVPAGLAHLVAVGATAVLLLTLVPPLRYGWWSLIGGSGNVLLGQTGHSGTLWRLVGIALPLILVVVVPWLAHLEESTFRAGSENRSVPRRLAVQLGFGLIHCMAGVPLAVGIALTLTLPTDESVGILLPRLGCLGGYHAAAVGPRYTGSCRTTPSDVGSGGSRRCLIRATERREGRTWPRRLGRATAVSDAGNHSMS